MFEFGSCKMNNKELRDHGYLYDATDKDPQMAKERVDVKALCFEFSTQVPWNDNERRKELLSKIIGKAGKNVFILPSFYCDYGYNIEVGDNFFANHNLVILDGAKVKIGNNVFFANNITLTTAGHPIDAQMRNTGIEYAYPITIGNDVWVGANVTILPGVTIGSNVVIGAGSVVTRDIPDGVVAVGNPCRVMRKITPEDKLKYQVPPKCCQQGN